MTPLEAARRMAEHAPTVLDSVRNVLYCGYCGYPIAKPADHAPDCPWPVCPEIVKALEASP